VKQNTKVIFLGTPDVAAETLRGLIGAGFSISAIITQPEKPKGRSGQNTPTPVKKVALQENIPVYEPTSQQELSKILHDLKPDIAIMVAYGMLLSKEMLEIPRFGFLNIHYSLLPKYRGAAPYVESILNGDKKTGVSIVQTSLGLDEGDIIAQREYLLKGDETAALLLDKLTELGTQLFIETYPLVLSGVVEPQEQVGTPSYSKKITKEAGHIDWKKSAVQIERMIRAYTPWPGSYSFVKDARIKILKTDLTPSREPKMTSDTGIMHFDNGHIFIATGDGSLEILELQPEGKKPMSATAFVNGNSKLNNSKLT